MFQNCVIIPAADQCAYNKSCGQGVKTMLNSFFNFLLSIRIPYELICFLFGILCGFVIYRKFGPECKRLKLEEEKQRYQRREAEAKRRLESYARRKAEQAKLAEQEKVKQFYKECAERGIDYSFSHGVYLSTDEVLYCPSCYSFYKLSEMTPNSKSRMLYCCECGKIISMEPKRIF